MQFLTFAGAVTIPRHPCDDTWNEVCKVFFLDFPVTSEDRDSSKSDMWARTVKEIS